MERNLKGPKRNMYTVITEKRLFFLWKRRDKIIRLFLRVCKAQLFILSFHCLRLLLNSILFVFFYCVRKLHIQLILYTLGNVFLTAKYFSSKYEICVATAETSRRPLSPRRMQLSCHQVASAHLQLWELTFGRRISNFN